MKKIFTIFLILFLSISAVIASGENYYRYESNLDVKFVPLNDTDSLDKDARKEYKKILKNEKYFAKKKYSKAEKLFPDFLPNVARLINVYSDKKDFPKALEYAIKLNELDKINLFPKSAKEYRLGVLYSQNGDYINSNKYLLPYINTNSLALFQVAQNYYFMQDLKTAAMYAQKISDNSEIFISAQEMLYNIYGIIKQPGKAYTAAKNLVKYDPANPGNYLKLASVTTNNAEKLTNLYRAKKIYKLQELYTVLPQMNKSIITLEKQKIDNAYKKITVYCKKPDWNKIKNKNANFLKDDILYWDSRQNEFFETANDCIARYKGNNLAACFNDLILTEEKLDKELIAENARREAEAQKQAEIMLLMRQNALIEEQNRLQWMRYNYYYPRYYYGYWW